MTRFPSPAATETKPFWDGCALGVVRYQFCAECGHVQLIPQSLCAKCQGARLEWKDSRGLGHILSYTVVHRAPTPVFREEVPYAIAVIDMDEGFRLMTNVAGGGSTPLAIGQRMRIDFRNVEGVMLPHAETCK